MFHESPISQSKAANLPNIQRKGGGGKERTDICNKISSFIEPHDHNEAEHAFHTDHDFIT